MQIDNPERGFSYKANATLDMRMDVSKNKPAYELLRNMTVKRLAHILNEFSDEPYADTIAYGVLKHSNVPQTTFELGNRIKEVVITYLLTYSLTYSLPYSIS
jgi:16S rRNA (cytosine1402-N4)-methyltransferase